MTTNKAGATFHRCALQVNPQDYLSKFRGQEADGDIHAHAESIVAKATEIGVSVLAVTNHNDVSGVAVFQDAAEGTGVTIFPGFEASSSEGIHVLCIYPPDTRESLLSRFLGQFGILEMGASAALSNQPLERILETVRKQGGVTIAAHVTNEKGLLNTLSGQARIKAWRNPELLAIQIPGPIDTLPPNFRRIVENKDSEHRRAYPAGGVLAVAAVNAKDVATPDDLGDHSATCWIKMSEVGIEGLRQAFLDPDSRIRLNPLQGEPNLVEDHAEIVSLDWQGGLLDGESVLLNSNLNVLLGGRGAGKSTVIESLRYVLGLKPVGDAARDAHDGIVRNVLRGGTKVELVVRCCRPTSREYRIERTVPNPPVVRDADGAVSNMRPHELLPRVEVYGQHEISDLATSRPKLTRLLHRFVDHDQSSARRKASLRRDLEKTRRSLLDASKELRQITDRLATLPGLEERLERFREAGLEDRLRERSLLVREEKILESITGRLQPFRDLLNNTRDDIPVDLRFLSSNAMAELPGREILLEAHPVLERLNRDVKKVAQLLDDALLQADDSIARIQARWNRRKRAVETEYERILRDLRRSAVDAEEFIRLRRDIEELRPLREHESFLQRLALEQHGRRTDLLAEWEEVKAEDFRLLDRAARKVTRALHDRVQIEVTAAGDREPLFQLLRSRVGGRLTEAIVCLEKANDLSLPQLVADCRSGADRLRRTYGIPAGQAQRLAGAPAEALMLIEELDLPAVTQIRLNIAPSGEPPVWKSLEDLSTGQKATAVLLLLLLESDSPLIIDQPEDDLDNRFITEGIVPRMREAKRRRQFVFSTHNANIPVLGDAELILGLTANGEAGGTARFAPDHIGSIDDRSVRDLIEELLEGGKDAFERRRMKYGF